MRKIIPAVFTLVLFAGTARAKYVPIPDYRGSSVGSRSSQDTNNRFSVTQATSLRPVSILYSSLGTLLNSQLHACLNCQQTARCTSGASGPIAFSYGEQWECGLPGSRRSTTSCWGGRSSACNQAIGSPVNVPLVQSGSDARSASAARTDLPLLPAVLDADSFGDANAIHFETKQLPTGSVPPSRHGQYPRDVGGPLSRAAAPGRGPRFINPVDYGADPTGVVNSTPAIQAAVNAACAAMDSRWNGEGGTPNIKFPTGRYLLDSPILLSCGSLSPGPRAIGMDISGAGENSTEFVANYDGPIFFYTAPDTISNLTRSATGSIIGAPLVNGAGGSLYFGDKAKSWVMDLDLRDDLQGPSGTSASYPFNGLPAFDVRYFFRSPRGTGCAGPAVHAGDSFGHGPYNANTTFFVSDGLDSQRPCRVTCAIRTTSGYYSVTSNQDIAGTTVYEVELSYDGSNLRLIINGILRATSPATGALVEDHPDQDIQIGDAPQMWPYAIGNAGGTTRGWIDSVEISNVARSTCGGSTTLGTTCYKPRTSKFTNDSHTLFLCNFDHVFLNGTLIQSDDSTGGYMALLTDSTALGAGNSFRNFDMRGGNFEIEAENAPFTQIRNVRNDFNGCPREGAIRLLTNSYASTISDVTLCGGYAPIATVFAGILRVISPNINCGAFCGVFQSADIFDPYMNIGSNAYAGLVLGGGGVVVDPNEDEESGGNMIGVMLGDAQGAAGPNVQWTFIGGELGSIKKPTIEIANGFGHNGSVLLLGTSMLTSGASDLINFDSGANLLTPMLILGGNVNGSTYSSPPITLTNKPSSVTIFP